MQCQSDFFTPSLEWVKTSFEKQSKRDRAEACTQTDMSDGNNVMDACTQTDMSVDACTQTDTSDGNNVMDACSQTNMSVDACTHTECESEVPLVSLVIQTDQMDMSHVSVDNGDLQQHLMSPVAGSCIVSIPLAPNHSLTEPVA